jgi:hypothetical protein
MHQWAKSRCFGVVSLLTILSLPLAAQDWKANPRELVRRAVQNEAKVPSPAQYFQFRDTKQTKAGNIETREMIQTPDLVLGRLVAIDGQPLSEEQRKNEDGRLNRLINSPDELNKKRKEQREDDQRVRRMVGALPDAFQYEYVGTEPSDSGQLVILKFSPDPNWEPPTRELSVYTGMFGTMKIAVPHYRLALMQAQLFKNVTFGWGILGHLDKGGDFMIEQGEVYPSHWDLTKMKLHFTGKVLLFKSLYIQQDEAFSAFRPVPEMNVAQALDRLKQAEVEYAKKTSGAH